MKLPMVPTQRITARQRPRIRARETAQQASRSIVASLVGHHRRALLLQREQTSHDGNPSRPVRWHCLKPPSSRQDDTRREFGTRVQMAS